MKEIGVISKKENGNAPEIVLESPGPLREEFILILHTREARKMVAGRQALWEPESPKGQNHQYGVLALTAFGKRMTRIWVAAQYDDPYADWYLWRIEQALAEAKSVLMNKKREINEMLDSIDSIKVRSSLSISPIEIPLKFASPYGYQGAFLLAEYDTLVCSIMTAWHIGLIDREPRRALLQSISKLIRRSFLLATRWQFSNITRADIQAGDDVAPALKSRMGKLPQEFLEMKLRAKVAPEIRHSIKTFALPTGEVKNAAKPGWGQGRKPDAPFVLPVTLTEELVAAE